MVDNVGRGAAADSECNSIKLLVVQGALASMNGCSAFAERFKGFDHIPSRSIRFHRSAFDTCPSSFTASHCTSFSSARRTPIVSWPFHFIGAITRLETFIRDPSILLTLHGRLAE